MITTQRVFDFIVKYYTYLFWSFLVAGALIGFVVPSFGSFMAGYFFASGFAMIFGIKSLTDVYNAGYKQAKKDMLMDSFR